MFARSLHLYPTLCDPMPTRLLCPWDSQSKNTGVGLPCPPPGHLPYLGIQPALLTSPTLVGGFFTTFATLKAHVYIYLLTLEVNI